MPHQMLVGAAQSVLHFLKNLKPLHLDLALPPYFKGKISEDMTSKLVPPYLCLWPSRSWPKPVLDAWMCRGGRSTSPDLNTSSLFSKSSNVHQNATEARLCLLSLYLLLLSSKSANRPAMFTTLSLGYQNGLKTLHFCRCKKHSRKSAVYTAVGMYFTLDRGCILH